MSKLFKQLKEAAKLRESAVPSSEKTTLLQQAMQRAASDARSSDAAPPDPISAPEIAPAVASAGRALRWGSVAAVAVVALGVGWQLGAMRSASPPAEALAPGAPASWPGMKIEKTLDLTRTGGAARSSPPGPAPSR